MCRQGQNSPHMADLSPVPVTHLSQNKLVPLLLERVQARGLCDVRFSNRVEGYRETESGLRIKITPEQVPSARTHGMHVPALGSIS